jgi:bifunctional non-homologous end joining protein LigD
VVLDKLGLRCYPKTSGATGMQVMIPLDGTHDYDSVRGFVGTVSDLVHAAEPQVTTLEWEVSRRTGKVFLDVNMNRGGANIAAAYSVRPEPEKRIFSMRCVSRLVKEASRYVGHGRLTC